MKRKYPLGLMAPLALALSSAFGCATVLGESPAERSHAALAALNAECPNQELARDPRTGYLVCPKDLPSSAQVAALKAERSRKDRADEMYIRGCKRDEKRPLDGHQQWICKLPQAGCEFIEASQGGPLWICDDAPPEAATCVTVSRITSKGRTEKAQHKVCEQPVLDEDGDKMWIEGRQQNKPTDYYCDVGTIDGKKVWVCFKDSAGPGSDEVVQTITPPPG